MRQPRVGRRTPWEAQAEQRALKAVASTAVGRSRVMMRLAATRRPPSSRSSWRPSSIGHAWWGSRVKPEWEGNLSMKHCY